MREEREVEMIIISESCGCYLSTFSSLWAATDRGDRTDSAILRVLVLIDDSASIVRVTIIKQHCTNTTKHKKPAEAD